MLMAMIVKWWRCAPKAPETATVIVGKLPAGIVLSKRLETELG